MLPYACRMTTLLSILGARPQFIKAAPLHRALAAAGAQHALLHTGQHYDDAMSADFFAELGLPQPVANLGIANISREAMLLKMEHALREYLAAHTPAAVIVYGDTNSTLAGARAARALHIPVSHVEAGLRSFNPRMAEELNRIETDRLSQLLFCPTPTALGQLEKEGIAQGAHYTGDIMLDTLRLMQPKLQACDVLARLALREKSYILATCHRAETTNDAAALQAVMAGLDALCDIAPVLLPLHPRTRDALNQFSIALGRVRLLPPLPYLDMACLLRGAKLAATDSGGVQKEAYFHHVPCLTLRSETEWPETVQAGANLLAPPGANLLVSAKKILATPATWPPLFGNGDAAGIMAKLLLEITAQR